MASCKEDDKEIGAQLLIELEEAKKKLGIMRDVVDVVGDVLEAAEKGIKRLREGKNER